MDDTTMFRWTHLYQPLEDEKEQWPTYNRSRSNWALMWWSFACYMGHWSEHRFVMLLLNFLPAFPHLPMLDNITHVYLNEICTYLSGTQCQLSCSSCNRRPKQTNHKISSYYTSCVCTNLSTQSITGGRQAFSKSNTSHIHKLHG